MGWRPQEMAKLEISRINLEEQYITDGMKTDSGRDRSVPIHPRIKDLMQRNYDKAVALGSKFLLNDPKAVKGEMTIAYDKYAGRFAKVVEALKLREDHRPHDPRTTFITMVKRANVDEYVIKILVAFTLLPTSILLTNFCEF